MLVVSDTSPLTALIQIGLAHLLPSLFERVVVPPAVRAELLAAHATIPEWREVQTPSTVPLAVRAARLDLGETESLALALELRPELVLMDEQLGRRTARELGLRVTGILGVLLIAKERGHVTEIKPVIEDLRKRAGCWFSEPLVAGVLSEAGEI